MKLIHSIVVIAIVFLSPAVYAFDMKDIAAYPVPFNPKITVLTIGAPGVSFPAGYSVKAEIFDVNGDLVISRTRSGADLKWNGRGSSGNFVKPGLYILKVQMESEDGDYGKKIIRILVKY